MKSFGKLIKNKILMQVKEQLESIKFVYRLGRCMKDDVIPTSFFSGSAFEGH